MIHNFEEFVNENINNKKLKFTQIIEQSEPYSNIVYNKKYCINDVICCEVKAYKEWTSSIDKNGIPSNLRDKLKTVKETRWNIYELGQVFGEEVSPKYFKNKLPDFNYGYNGTAISFTEFKKMINEYVKTL
jgi:hypothetical protein